MTALDASDALQDAEREIKEALEKLQRRLPAGALVGVNVDWICNQIFGEPPTYIPRVNVTATIQSGGDGWRP